jgi:hypothetical protein
MCTKFNGSDKFSNWPTRIAQFQATLVENFGSDPSKGLSDLQG